MKKLILFILCMAQIMTLCVSANAAGGGIMIGDSNSETMFTGSVSEHCVVLSGGGVVSAFGKNDFGQCGSAACDELNEINYIDFEHKVTKVIAGNDFSLALDETGTAWGWGNNTKYQLGISRPTDTSGTPTSFTAPQKIADNIAAISAGDNFSMLLTNDGKVLFSGMGNRNVKVAFPFPEMNLSVPEIKIIAAGYNNAVAVDKNNNIFYWKSDVQGLQAIEKFTEGEIVAAACGSEHIVIAVKDNENYIIYTLGDNTHHQLGVTDVPFSDTPVPSLTIPCEEDNKISVFAGEYYTSVNKWSTISESEQIDEYCWGTNSFYMQGNDYEFVEGVIEEPLQYTVPHQIVALGSNRSLVFDFVDGCIILYSQEVSKCIPLLESENTSTVMYPYQYKNTEYNTVNVNFIKIYETEFNEENADITGEKYEHWEYVNDHQFNVKIKDFISGIGNSTYNPSLGIVRLGKETTKENRIVGTVITKLWNFNRTQDMFSTSNKEIEHGSEDGTSITVTGVTNKNHTPENLNLPPDIDIFYTECGEITESTKLGLYVYGLPAGISVAVKNISDNKFDIELTGNSVADMDYDTPIRLCYVYISGNQTAKGVVGDYNLEDIIMSATEHTIGGFTIKAIQSTPETITIMSNLTKGKENGKTIDITIAGGEFANELNAKNWSINGINELSIASVTRLDDRNAQIVISGNSADKYTDASITVTCSGDEYSDSRFFDEETGLYRNISLSSNSITVKKQVKSSGGSSSGIITSPTVSEPSGEIAIGTNIKLSSSIQNAKIYYTTDGTTPTLASKLYNEPITINQDTTIKFIAVSGTRKSTVQTVSYTIRTANIKLKENAKEIKYFKTNDSKMFYPDKAITRYEILSALEQLFEIENLGAKSTFTDVDKEYEDLVDLFVGARLVQGYTDNTFRGNEGITRAEFVEIMSNMLNPKTTMSQSGFTDIEGHWCQKKIDDFSKLGFVAGYPDKSFRPDNTITRAEAIVILNRVSGITAIQATNYHFDDLNGTHWACDDIYTICN